MYVGSFTDVAKGKEIAMQMYQDDMKLIQAYAGGAGMGVYQAAESLPEGYYALGAANGQFHLSERIIASQIKFADLCDLLPTILDAAGASYPGELPLPGRSLLEAVKHNRIRDIQYVEQSSGARRWISIRDYRYKYNYYYAQGMEELFDLAEDPQERYNLLEVPERLPQEECRQLKDRLYRMENRWGPAGLTQNGKFQVFGPVEPKAKLPATFPLFGKHLPKSEKLLPLWQEILLAVREEPAVDLRKLCWDEWLAAGLVDQELVDKVLVGAAEQT